jgi:hypothetical protein
MFLTAKLTRSARTHRLSQVARVAWQRDWAALAVTLMAATIWWFGRGSVAADMILGSASLLLGFMAPAWLPALWAFCLPFEYSREVSGLGTVYTGEFLLLMALPGAAWQCCKQPAWRDRALAALGWFWPFLVVLALSAWHANTAAAWKGLLRWWEFILAFLLGWFWLRRGQDSERVLWALVAAAVISACLGVAESAAGAGARPDLTRVWLNGGETVRAAAGLGANALAMFLALLLPFTAAAGLFHPRPWGRLAGTLACAAMTAGLVATFSVTGWLAAGCAMVVLLGFACAEQPRLGVWLASAALAAVALLIGLKPEWLSGPFWETKLLSWQDRMDYIFVSGRMLASSPWLGIGPGLYRHLAPLWGTGIANPIGLLTHPHSLWLIVLVETGALGLAALGLAAWRFAAKVWEGVRRLQPGWPQAAGWALAAGLVGFFAANFTEHGLVHDRGAAAALAAAAALVWIQRAGQAKGTLRPRRWEPKP